MTLNNPACPHCSGPRPDHLVARNYLCASCQERATDVIGWTVTLLNDAKEISPGHFTTVGNGARHVDGSRCLEVPERSIAYVDGTAYVVAEGRFGGVFLRPPTSTEPPASEVDPGADDMEQLWAAMTAQLQDEVQWLKDGDFVTVNYLSEDPDYALYGQLAPEEDGFHLEVVSNKYMPADDWPLDTEYLQEAGWLAPDEETPNWFRVCTGSAAAASALLLALRFGRGCSDARRLDWHPATFPRELED